MPCQFLHSALPLSLIGRRREMRCLFAHVCAALGGGECVGEVSNLFIKGAKENQRNARATFLPPYIYNTPSIDCLRTLRVSEKKPKYQLRNCNAPFKKGMSRTIDLKSQRNSSTRAPLCFRLFLVN
jgi:hypothetical protein